ncbi:leucine-rich repeat-containing protein 19-like [Megalops cyprinoides]|uniref:leucine-rich repeat-containing protein 19-like n=1 Tax=Megalops cyprinoides TaxID=118141 RepID=UPI0018642E93|nr:leucine-rich repeat-containing protein 19-like [Megalops cyprinoides]
MASSSLLLLCIGFVEVASTLDTNFSKSLHQIPSDLLSNITKLNLSHNAIALSEVDIETLKNYSKLTELYLDNNMLTVLPGHMFASLPELRILNVSSNNISRVEPKSFAGLADLSVLDLSRNSIPSLPPGVFSNLSSLEGLYLQGNNLHSLENGTFVDLKRLSRLDLDGNPWNCSCVFLWVLNCLNGSRVQIDQGAVCAYPEDKAGKNILNSIATCFMEPKTTGAPSVTAATSVLTMHTHPTGHNNSGNLTSSNKEASEGIPATGSSWKFLAAVVVIALGTSLLIVCAVKSPSCYKLMFDYRHRRLREEDEEEEPDLFTTHCHSNFSLEAEQMETSAQELDAGADDEDSYIDTAVSRDNKEA